MLVRVWRKRNPHTLLVGNSMEAPQKIKNRTAICSSNSISRDIPEGI
jgi:hypothetical protein